MRVAVVLLVLLSACQFVVGDDADDEDDYIDCNGLPVRALRDPRTGTCTPVGRVGSERECKACGTCVPADLQVMGRAECGSSARCENHTEFDCVHDSGCRTVYAADSSRYLGCWEVAPTGITGQGPCAGLDADACSGRASCSAWYAWSGATPIAFDHCGDAPPLTACEWAVCEPDKQCRQDCTPCDASGGASCDVNCQATCVSQGCDQLACSLGNVCRETCVRWGPQYPPQCFASCQGFEVGSPGLCDGPITCAASPPACPAGTIAGRADGCYTGFCIPATACGEGRPGTCQPVRASDTPPACPPDTVAGTRDSGSTGYCIPLAACGSSPLGTCEPATDPGTPPACTDGSIPGTIDGRYTGACIPSRQCPRLPCDALVTEPACAARADCRAIDRGSDCTCAAVGCSCAVRAFDRCEAAPAGPGG
jgi:hypothetical protein